MELILITFFLVSFMMLLLSAGFMIGKRQIKSTCARLSDEYNDGDYCEHCSCHTEQGVRRR